MKSILLQLVQHVNNNIRKKLNSEGASIKNQTVPLTHLTLFNTSILVFFHHHHFDFFAVATIIAWKFA